MIEDAELRSLFRAESEEHLSALEAGLLALEQGHGDAATLDQVFRDAHSLKGAARMLELQDIEMLTHGMEDLLRAARDRQQPPDAAAFKALFPSLDAARVLSAAAAADGGQPAEVDVGSLLDALRAAETADQDASPANPVKAPLSETVAEPVAEPVAESSAPHHRRASALDADPDTQPTADVTAPAGKGGAAYELETIRVASTKLDDLLRRCGELIVTQQRAAQIDDGLARFASDLDALRQSVAQADRTTDDAGHWVETMAGLVSRVGELRDRLREDNGQLRELTRQLSDGVRTARLLPLTTLFALFPRTVRDVAEQEGKQAELMIEGGATTVDKQIIEKLKDPLMHILRNAVHHGIEPPAQRLLAGKAERGSIRLTAQRMGSTVRIEVSDDGRGVDAEQVRAAVLRFGAASPATPADGQQKHLLESLFLPGLTTEQMLTDISGRGVGLDVVRTSIEALKGSVQVQSEPGEGFRLQLDLPVTLATTRILLLQVSDSLLGLPMDTVQTMFRVGSDSLYWLEGRPTLDYADQALSVLDLGQVLDLRTTLGREDQPDHCIVIGQRKRRVALLVDAVIGAQEVVLKPLGGVLRRVRGVAGATILSSGEVCPVLAPNDLITADTLSGERNLAMRSGRPGLASAPTDTANTEQEQQRHLLLVDDSMLTRVQEKRLLESAGYRVTVAVDGLDALSRLRAPSPQMDMPRSTGTARFDAVITDINMPRMDGLKLTEQIRADPRLRALPVVLVTSLASEADRRRGLDAGASAYITKGGFDNRLLLSTLERLI